MVSARIQFPEIDIGNTYGDFYSPLDIVSFNTTPAPYHFEFPASGKAKYLGSPQIFWERNIRAISAARILC